MAVPVSSGHVKTETDSFVTSLAINLPGSPVAGQLYFIAVMHRGNQDAFNVPAGWELGPWGAGDATHTCMVIYKVATGSEGATQTVSKAGGTGVRWIAQAWKVIGKTFTLADVEFATAVTGTGDNPNPPSLTPSWTADTLFTTVLCHEEDTSAPTVPSGYSAAALDAINAGEGRVITSERSVTNHSGSENPGAWAFTAPGSSDAFMVATMAIRGDSPITPSPVTIPLAIAAPTITVHRLVSPNPVTVPLVIPTPSIITVHLAPDPVAVPLAVAAPTLSHVLTLSPSPVTVPMSVPAPVVVVDRIISPSPVTIPIVTAAPTITVQELTGNIRTWTPAWTSGWV